MASVRIACKHSMLRATWRGPWIFPGAPTHARNAGAPSFLNQVWNTARSAGCSGPRGELAKGGSSEHDFGSSDFG